MTVLTASHLTRRFGSRVAVDDLSFELLPGEIFALLGPNGAGKTTTLRMLAGLIAPSSGEVRIGADTMTSGSASRLRGRIGFLTEAPGLWERLDVYRNLLVYARLHGVPDPGRAVRAALETFDLLDRAGDAAGQLSKGLKQRVALARTLLHGPSVVLLDEPTSGLDPESAREVRDLVLRLCGKGHTILLSTHNLDEVERIASRVGVMRTTLIAVGTPAELRARLFGSRLRVTLAQPAEQFRGVVTASGFSDVRAEDTTLSIGVDAVAQAAPLIVRRLVDGGADVHSVVPEEPRLEDVYLKLLEGDAPAALATRGGTTA